MSKTAKDLAAQRSRVYRIGAAESRPHIVDSAGVKPSPAAPAVPSDRDREIARAVLAHKPR